MIIRQELVGAGTGCLLPENIVCILRLLHFFFQLHFGLYFIMEANTINLDQTGPLRLWYIRTLPDKRVNHKSRDSREKGIKTNYIDIQAASTSFPFP